MTMSTRFRWIATAVLALLFGASASALAQNATITGKAFRPRVNDVGRLRWLLLAICLFYLFCSVVLPLLITTPQELWAQYRLSALWHGSSP